jgi:16S rRNA (cytosine1402-N4)-methyltransferase
MHHIDQTNTHIPVLLEQVLQYLDPKAGDRYLDLTAGYGGHAEVILERTKQPERAILVDRDQNATKFLEEKFEGRGVKILNKDFLQASQELAFKGQQFDVLLADLGVSSPHLNQATRGFAIGASGPLDMRMDQNQILTASNIVNQYSEAALMEILVRYGEEPKARRIAHFITQNRPITTTTELASLVARAWPGRSKVHPATRTFQAFRIAVNDELAQISQSIPLWLELLAPGGLEDRLVKQAFQDESGGRYDATLDLLTKHPVTADDHESVFNPRARSAKLRAAVKINTKERDDYANNGSTTFQSS